MNPPHWGNTVKSSIRDTNIFSLLCSFNKKCPHSSAKNLSESIFQCFFHVLPIFVKYWVEAYTCISGHLSFTPSEWRSDLSHTQPTIMVSLVHWQTQISRNGVACCCSLLSGWSSILCLPGHDCPSFVNRIRRLSLSSMF